MTAGRRVLALVALGALALPGAAHAVDIRPVLVVGIDTGGDKIVTVTFTNGDTKSIRANEGLFIGGGFSALNDDKTIEFQGTVNYKYASITADNGDVTWTRIPIDALLFYRWEKFRLGGGVTYHISPSLKGSGAAGNVNVDVDNAVGAIVQGDLVFGKFFIGGRYTFLSYKANGGTAKSDGVGIEVGIRF